MLFATLDPTTRAIALPHGLKVVLSDTVGFISDLPTQLVAAFRATLEDVISADIILHVRDIANADTAAQELDVRQVLADLGISGAATQRIIEVWNKADLLPPDEAGRLAAVAQRRGEGAPVLVSALTGLGIRSFWGKSNAGFPAVGCAIRSACRWKMGQGLPGCMPRPRCWRGGTTAVPASCRSPYGWGQKRRGACCGAFRRPGGRPEPRLVRGECGPV